MTGPLALAVLIASAPLLGISAQNGAEPVSRAVIPLLAKDRPSGVVDYAAATSDTLETIATRFATTALRLRQINGIPAPSDVAAGQTVLVPDPGPAPPLLPCGDLLAPVDKEHGLPESCEPSVLQTLPPTFSYGGEQALHPGAADALVALLSAAADAGHELVVRSSYRSYATQVATFAFWVDQLGYHEAVRVSAPPGHSEHQLGTTADVTNATAGFELVEAFGETDGGRWLAEHAASYGFVISYPRGAEAITGFSFEPWHIRWTGAATASAVAMEGVTLHEYLLEHWQPGRHLLDNGGID